MANSQARQMGGDKAKRSVGVFHRLPLSKVLELPTAVFQLGHGDPVRRLTVFDSLGRSPNSGSSRALIAAANSGYGVVIGSAASEYLSLTEDGRAIVSAKLEPDKNAAIYQVLFSNQVFSDFVDHFKDRPLPIDEIAIDYLRSAHGLSSADASSAWDVIKENVLKYGLVHELSGKSVLVSDKIALQASGRPQTLEAKAPETELPLPNEGDETIRRPLREHARGVTPQIVFNIQIVLPENASAKDYDNIFESIGKHLLDRFE